MIPPCKTVDFFRSSNFSQRTFERTKRRGISWTGTASPPRQSAAVAEHLQTALAVYQEYLRLIAPPARRGTRPRIAPLIPLGNCLEVIDTSRSGPTGRELMALANLGSVRPARQATSLAFGAGCLGGRACLPGSGGHTAHAGPAPLRPGAGPALALVALLGPKPICGDGWRWRAPPLHALWRAWQRCIRCGEHGRRQGVRPWNRN